MKTVLHLFAGESPVADMVVSKNPSSALSAKTIYLHPDVLGSKNAISDESGKPIERLAYQPYGSLMRDVGPAAAASSYGNSEAGFTGQRTIAGTSLIDFNGRLYDPSISQFLTPDPELTDGTTMAGYNRYAYTRHDPLDWTDPSGFQTVDPFQSHTYGDTSFGFPIINLNAGGISGTGSFPSLSIGNLSVPVGAFSRFKTAAGQTAFDLEDKYGNVPAWKWGVGAGLSTALVGGIFVEGAVAGAATGLSAAASRASIYIGAALNTRVPWLIPLVYHTAAGYIGAPTYSAPTVVAVNSFMSTAEKFAPDAENTIGRSFGSLEEAAASGGGHQAQVTVRRYGQQIATWWESSHTGSKFGGHTEQKALARIIEYVNKSGGFGLEVEIAGFHPPCPYCCGCMNSMQAFADQTGIMVEYLRANGSVFRFLALE